MTERPDQRPDERPEDPHPRDVGSPPPGLPPSVDQAIRRALVDARHTEPMPAAVVDRLDRVLAELRRDAAEGGEAAATRAAGVDTQLDTEPVAEPVAGLDTELETGLETGAGAVIDLAARRRKRWVQGLVAAAAVVSVGALGPTVWNDLRGAPMATRSGLEGGSVDSQVFDAAGEGSDQSSAGGQALPQAAQAPPTAMPHVRADNLRRDLKAALTRESGAMASQPSDSPPVPDTGPTPRSQPDAAAVCLPPSGQEPLLYVTYGLGFQPAMVLPGPVVGERQRVRIVLCGTTKALRSVLLPR